MYTHLPLPADLGGAPRDLRLRAGAFFFGELRRDFAVSMDLGWGWDR